MKQGLPHWELIEQFFELSPLQVQRLQKLYSLYAAWNAKINVVSRKQFEEFYLRHVLHSLSILQFVDFVPATRVLDLGTGGGFPGIPLAIMREKVRVHMIDSLRKKTTVVQAVIDDLGLKNASVEHVRAENCTFKAHFVTARAVTALESLRRWASRMVTEEQLNALPNGLLCLKGGDPKAEIKTIPKGEYTEVWWLRDKIDVPYLDQKYLLYLQI